MSQATVFYLTVRNSCFSVHTNKQMNPINIDHNALHLLMGTYTDLLYHIVFGTKYRIPCLQKNKRHILLKYIRGILNKNKCHLYRINGIEDHLHILTHTCPTSGGFIQQWR